MTTEPTAPANKAGALRSVVKMLREIAHMEQCAADRRYADAKALEHEADAIERAAPATVGERIFGPGPGSATKAEIEQRTQVLRSMISDLGPRESGQGDGEVGHSAQQVGQKAAASPSLSNAGRHLPDCEVHYGDWRSCTCGADIQRSPSQGGDRGEGRGQTQPEPAQTGPSLSGVPQGKPAVAPGPSPSSTSPEIERQCCGEYLSGNSRCPACPERVVVEYEAFSMKYGLVRLEMWPRGLMLLVEGRIVWRSWSVPSPARGKCPACDAGIFHAVCAPYPEHPTPGPVPPASQGECTFVFRWDADLCSTCGKPQSKHRRPSPQQTEGMAAEWRRQRELALAPGIDRWPAILIEHGDRMADALDTKDAEIARLRSMLAHSETVANGWQERYLDAHARADREMHTREAAERERDAMRAVVEAAKRLQWTINHGHIANHVELFAALAALDKGGK